MIETKSEQVNYSIFRSILWLLLLSLGVQIMAAFISAFSFSIFEKENTFESLEHPFSMGVISLLSIGLVLPMLKRASKQLNQTSCWAFLGFKKINKIILLKVVILTFIYYGSLTLILDIAGVPAPDFMLEIRAQTNTFSDVIMLITAVCIVAPIMEEILFRGVGYGRLKNSKLRALGAILLSSLLFTLIHLQYNMIDMLSILLLALLLGYVRYKTDNIWYCIAMHFQVNVLSMILLFSLS